MLKSIIQKEILDHLYSLRFIVGLILSISVTVTCVVILTHDYEQELTDYNERIVMQDDFLNNYAHTNRLGPMIRAQEPPEIFRPFIIGVQKDADLGSFDDNPLPVLFPPLDLVFIVTIILSLMALLFSYDAVCGERENSTLKLMLSNSIPKAGILLGKWIGGSITLFIPFLLSLLVGALYVILHPSIHWDGAAWMTFILFILASVTFVSVFHLLGLLVSAFSRISSISILTCLFVWVLLVLAIPNLSPYIAAQFFRIPSVNRIEKEVSRLTGVERDALGRQLTAEIRQRYETEYGKPFAEFQSMDQQAILSRLRTDESFRSMVEAYRDETDNAWMEANRIQGEKADAISRELTMKADTQTGVAKHIACLSPYANFVYLATDLTGTGLRGMDYFNQSVGVFSQTFNPYLERKVQQARETDPLFNSESFIDLSDRPRFAFKEESVKDKLTAVLPYWGILLFFNILFFTIAFIGFLKYDVR
ncbi:MAG: ABC transporter permease subunit [bacterium]